MAQGRAEEAAKIIGRALLRILAGSLALHSKLWHATWRAGSVPASASAFPALVSARGMAATVADSVASAVLSLGVAIPCESRALCAMSAVVVARDRHADIADAIAGLADDADRVARDAQTLSVSLALEAHGEIGSLLCDLEASCLALSDRLSRLSRDDGAHGQGPGMREMLHA